MVLFDITFNSKIPEMLMFARYFDRREGKKTLNEIYFNISSISRQC